MKSNMQSQSQKTERSTPLLIPAPPPDTSSSAAAAACCSSTRNWLEDSVWPGLGLFGESYLLFSIGTLKPVWEILFPDCWQGDDYGENAAMVVCSDALLHSLSYSVVAGVITGMIFIGTTANTTGRRTASILTAVIMAVGAVCLCMVSCLQTEDPNIMVRYMSGALYFFGVGVGGEYPLAASSASERAMEKMRLHRKQELLKEQEQEQQQQECNSNSMNTSNNDVGDDGNGEAGNDVGNDGLLVDIPDQDRGRQIQLVFTMQGMGIFCNSLVMTILLAVTGQTGKTTQGQNNNNNGNNGNNNNDNSYNDAEVYDPALLLLVWRITYAIGAAILLYVLLSRVLHLQESAVWQDDKEKREELREESLQKIAQMTTPTLAGTSGVQVRPHQHQRQQQQQQQHQDQLDQYQQDVGIMESLSNISMVSTVSSLTAASVAPQHHNAHDAQDFDFKNWQLHQLQQEPSTDPQDDLQAGSIRLLMRNYGIRLLGASVSWLLWDIAFYGNKLFQSTFLLALAGENSNITLLELSMASTLNAAVALCGYFGAAAIIDHPAIGRRGLQQWGFLLTGSLFVGVGFLYDNLNSSILVLMYLGSTFFGQLGPNATTFLIPAEIFPTEMRTMCHGIAAASGKVGALTAAVLFNYVDDLDMFLLSGYASFAAAAVTFWTIPETTGLDLYETDRKWRMILNGRKGEYVGAANHPKFLSLYERNKASMQSANYNYDVAAHNFD
jgi:hypothetical protein